MEEHEQQHQSILSKEELIIEMMRDLHDYIGTLASPTDYGPKLSIMNLQPDSNGDVAYCDEGSEIEEQQVEAPFSTISLNEDPNSAITSAKLGVEGTGIAQSTMDSGFMALSIYCAHMAPKWNSLLELRPKQRKDMSVEVYYDQFFNWKKKLNEVNYIGGEESYIDDFLFGLKMDLGVRVCGCKWKPHTLYGAFRRAEMEETMISLKEPSRKIDADKVFEEMSHPTSINIVASQGSADASNEDGNVVPGASGLVEDRFGSDLPVESTLQGDKSQVDVLEDSACNIFDEMPKLIAVEPNEEINGDKIPPIDCVLQVFDSGEATEIVATVGLMKMGSLKVAHNLFDKMLQQFSAKQKNGIEGHEKWESSVIDFQTYLGSEIDETKVGSTYSSLKMMFGEMAVFMFDPGISSWFYCGCDALEFTNGVAQVFDPGIGACGCDAFEFNNGVAQLFDPGIGATINISAKTGLLSTEGCSFISLLGNEVISSPFEGGTWLAYASCDMLDKMLKPSLVCLSLVYLSLLKMLGCDFIDSNGVKQDSIVKLGVGKVLKKQSTWRIFSLKELHSATNNFNYDNKLGEGAFGSVYWGQLWDGSQIAVKRLKVWSSKAEMEFAVEVEMMARVRHKNLLSRRGYCVEGQERLIVYDYMPNLSLLSHLHGQHSAECLLDWNRRMIIAIGAAEGIAYLHNHATPHIIHRDVKASNVLLDSDFQVRVADFGFAKFIPDGATHVTTRVKGTLGYLAPEYAMLGKASESCDVFSFGILLLELASGKKPIEKINSTYERTIIDWALPLACQRNFTDLADRRLYGVFDLEELKRVVLFVNQVHKVHLNRGVDLAMGTVSAMTGVIPYVMKIEDCSLIVNVERFIWDPGVFSVLVHILGDKDVFERVGKWIIPTDITWVKIEVIKDVQNNCIIMRWCEIDRYLRLSCDNANDGITFVIITGLRASLKILGRTITKEFLEITAPLEFDVVGLFWMLLFWFWMLRSYTSVFGFIWFLRIWNESCWFGFGRNERFSMVFPVDMLSILGSSLVTYKIFEIGKCNRTTLAKSASRLQLVPIDFSREAEDADKFNGATMDNVVWDLGLIWVSHFTTLRTRRLLRGRICHDPRLKTKKTAGKCIGVR